MFLVPLAAAQVPTLVSGTVKDVNGLAYANARVSAQLIPSTASPTIIVNGIPTQIGGQQNGSADVNGNFTMNLFCNSAGGGCSVISPAGTQWQITVTTNGAPPPLGTGPQSCSATITISGAAQTVSSSFSACPALSNPAGTTNNGATNPLGVSINVKAFPYSAVGNTQQTLPNVSTIAPGSNGCPAGAVTGCFVVPIPASGALFKQSDIGSTIYFNASGLNVLAPTTIAHVNLGTGGSLGSQMIDVAVWVLGGGCGGVCQGAWGTDDTLATQKAAGAAATFSQGANANCLTADNVIWQPTCAKLYYPPGGYMTSGGGTTTPGGPGFPGITTGTGTAQVGAGENATTFFLRPDYSIGALGGNLGFFLNNPCDIASDFQVSGTQFTFPFGSNSVVQSNCSSTSLERVRVSGIGNAGSALVSVGGNHDTVLNLMVQDPAGTNQAALCDFNGGIVDVFRLFCSNNNSTTVPNLQIRNYTGGTSGSRITIHGGSIDECNVTGTNSCTTVTAAKDVSFYGTTLLGGAFTSLAVNVDATSEVRCSGCTLAPFGGNASSDVTVAAGGKFSATLTKFIAFGGTRWIWSCGDANACVDDGGNIYTLLSGASQYAAGSSFPTFSLSSNATTQLGGQQVVNGNVPTGCTITGNGTSTCAFDAGSTDAAGRITITAAGTTTAVGLVSFSFSRTYGTNSTNCSGNYLSGTGTWAIGAVAPIFITSTTASASFNINNAGTNLTATSTYKVTYQCYGQ